jgi:hypothetical protein
MNMLLIIDVMIVGAALIVIGLAYWPRKDQHSVRGDNGKQPNCRQGNPQVLH